MTSIYQYKWQVEHDLVPYPLALERMEQHVADMRRLDKNEWLWLLEHPPLYTAGTSAKAEHLLGSHFPVFSAGRGGQYTYHGPGQRVVYVMLDLKSRYYPDTVDIRHFVWNLEEWIIRTLADLGVCSSRRQGRIGIWIDPHDYPMIGYSDAKIAALGIRIRAGVSYHGIAINVNPDLSHFSGIIPCGLSQFGVCSLASLGVHVSMSDLDNALYKQFNLLF